ncbi:5'-3' exonuclease H3TH domain-containing protein [Nocardioides sp.]|uniref:5'-3' exonuclease n=1 Tax=Nocardioides sp. TaxID=35761 RepID=UPI0035117A22
MSDHPQRLLLLDSASMYFRAFFGMPEHLAPDGTNVNAVRGMLDYVVRLLEEYRPQAAVCCWDDDWRPQWRVDLVPTYKAHRVVEPVPGGTDVEEVPDPLAVQVPILREVLGALGLAVVGAPEAEADDVIGTLATTWAAAGAGPVDVVTGDRDLFQLVDDAAGVRVLYIAKGVGRHERVDEAWVREKYGVEASQYADFATLRGDASDGLPGVAGIGEKTAAVLLGAHGDLAGVIAAAHDAASDLKPAARRRILEGLPYLAVAPEVVAVRRTLDLGTPALSVPAVPADPDALAALAQRWNLEGAVSRLLDVLADLSR